MRKTAMIAHAHLTSSITSLSRAHNYDIERLRLLSQQTNNVDPAEAAPEPPPPTKESRQVRRQRERLARKGRYI